MSTKPYTPIHKCRYCGCKKGNSCHDANGAPCYWVDEKCTVCSCCASGKGIKVKTVLKKALQK